MPTQKRLQLISFLIILLVMAGFVFAVVRPFADILIVGFILAVLFRPVYNFFAKRITSPSVASLATVAVILVILLVPVGLLGKVLFDQLLHLYNEFRTGHLVIDRSEIISGLPTQIQDFVQTATQDVNSLLSRFTANAFQTFSGVVSNLASFIISFFLTLFTTYYFLKDGHHFQQVLIDISPIDDKQERILFTKVSNAVNGVVKGQFLTALIQGVVATIGYWIFGMPSFLLWGIFTALAALVPTVGTSLALVPAILYLLITGHVGASIGLLVYGAVAVGGIDNFIGPRIIGRATQVHPLLMLIAVIGGVSVFGFLGFLLGPILMAIFVAMVNMYRSDFQAYLDT